MRSLLLLQKMVHIHLPLGFKRLNKVSKQRSFT